MAHIGRNGERQPHQGSAKLEALVAVRDGMPRLLQVAMPVIGLNQVLGDRCYSGDVVLGEVIRGVGASALVPQQGAAVSCGFLEVAVFWQGLREIGVCPASTRCTGPIAS